MKVTQVQNSKKFASLAFFLFKTTQLCVLKLIEIENILHTSIVRDGRLDQQAAIPFFISVVMKTSATDHLQSHVINHTCMFLLQLHSLAN